MTKIDKELLRALGDIYEIAGQIQYDPTSRHQAIQKLCMTVLDNVKKTKLVMDWINTVDIDPLQLQRLVENWSRYKKHKEISGPL